MSSRAGVIPKKGFNKVKAGGDQAFTLPYGTSAAPIMNVKYIPSIKVGGKTYTGTGGNPIKVTSHQGAGKTGTQTQFSTAKTIKHVDDWKIFFKEVNFKGDYYWFKPL